MGTNVKATIAARIGARCGSRAVSLEDILVCTATTVADLKLKHADFANVVAEVEGLYETMVLTKHDTDNTTEAFVSYGLVDFVRPAVEAIFGRYVD